jgi:tetratricopeptide (TPR) repeat protein
MPKDLHQYGFELLKAKRYSEALSIFLKTTEKDPSFWVNWKNAGSCCLHMNDLDAALTYFKRAFAINPDEPSILLDIGIVFQLKNNFTEAIEAFRRAIEISPDYELAYNSLAFTQKKQGELEKALHNYDAGAKALSRRIIKTLKNDRSSPVVKYRDIVGELWLEYAVYAAMYLVSQFDEDIQGIAWPTGEQAQEEERTEKHAGLYWKEVVNDKNETIRLLLPNYFNTFPHLLKQDAAYSNLIGNRGTILELLGRYDEARLHFDEATEFLPRVG